MSVLMVTVKFFSDRFEANVMASKLETNGIKAVLNHQDSVFADPSTFMNGKIELKVLESQAAEALAILSEEEVIE
jgi:hypothetical protein